MKKKNLRIKNIVGIFVIMLLASIFVMPVSAQSQGIPIKLELTAEPSPIEVGETAIITVRLLDENDKPVVTEVDISVSISTNLGSVPSSLIIPAKKDLSETQFTSEVSGIAVISAKSKGLISDTTSIAVVPLPTPTPSPSPSPTPMPTPTPTVPPAVTPTATPTIMPTAVPTATPTPTPTPLPPKAKPWGLIIGIIIAVVIVGAAAYYFYTKKKA